MDVWAATHPQHYTRISPGVVGSVGDCLSYTKLKTSLPSDLSYRAPLTNTGSNVQDGNTASYTSGGGPAKVLYKSFGYREHFRSRIGWTHQDLRPQNMTVLPRQAGRMSIYMERAARILRAGELKNPPYYPQGYVPTEMTRGSQIPRIISQGSSSMTAEIPAGSVVGRGPAINPAEASNINPPNTGRQITV
mgnify:CR=1 FL=1